MTVEAVNWERIPSPPDYRSGEAREAAGRLAAAVSPAQAGHSVADLRFAVSNDHRGTLPMLDRVSGEPSGLHHWRYRSVYGDDLAAV